MYNYKKDLLTNYKYFISIKYINSNAHYLKIFPSKYERKGYYYLNKTLCELIVNKKLSNKSSDKIIDCKIIKRSMYLNLI